MGKIALSQNISLDGVIQLDEEMQSPGPTDVPFKYTRWAVDFEGDREGARSTTTKRPGSSRRRTARPYCSDGSPTRPCRASGPQRRASSPTG